MRMNCGESTDRNPIGRMLNQIWNEPIFSEIRPLVTGTDEGTLALDISEDDSSVYVRASLPGFKKENIDIEVHEGVLSIKAQAHQDEEQKTERFYRKERRHTSLSRRVTLPGTVVEDQTQAEFKDGVLTLKLPKTPQAKPRKVNIA